MVFLLKYWKFGIGALAGALIMYGAMELRVWYINTLHDAEINNVRTSIIKQCEDDKKLTKDVSNEYQNQISDLNIRLIELKRVRPSVCIPITRTPFKCDAGSRSGHVDGNGVTSTALYDFAGKAERYRRQLIACQSFILKTWEAKKAPPRE